MSEKPWGGRFEAPTHPLMERFSNSLETDWRLALQDIRGSQAHAAMLARQGLISAQEAETLQRALAQLAEEVAEASGPAALGWTPADEDVHMAVERTLRERVGVAAARLHTGRSRNDQVALDLHLWVRQASLQLAEAVLALQGALLDQADKQGGVILPGYTHLQRAQPVTLGHHLLAYVGMLERDLGRLYDAARRADVSPLGAGALAGSDLPLDPASVAAELGFAGVYGNSLDAVSDRDFAIELASACSLIMMHLSRLGEELIVWSTAEFGFIELPDAFTTGSSMMPQKKNPDAAELVRGKAAGVFGDLQSLLVLMKGLPLAYNRDMQEDKPPLFHAVDTTLRSLEVLAPCLAAMRVNESRMLAAATGGFMEATDLADLLVLTGVPFREAHAMVGQLVRQCLASGISLAEAVAQAPAEWAPGLDRARLVERLSPQGLVGARRTAGGTSPELVAEARRQARERMAEWTETWRGMRARWGG